MLGPGLAALPTQGFLEEYQMTTQIRNRSRSSLFAVLSFPFVALWNLLSLIVQLVGRVLAVSIGLVLLIAGVLVSLTIVGAIIGVPLFIVGLLLVLRGIF